MASSKSGAGMDQIQKCNTRMQFLNIGAKIIESNTLDDGIVIETYQIPSEKGSAARAIMHGLLDVSTLGLWEIAGTPIESEMNKDRFITVKVTYSASGAVIKIELM